MPKTPDLPTPQRRLDELCAPGYTGIIRGEVVRTRTPNAQAHTAQWLGTFANPGTGAVLADLAGFCSVMGGKDYRVLDLPEVQRRVHLPPDQQFTRPESALVRALYLHRGAFEPALADEDQEQEPDRWCSHSPCGQEAWQIIPQ